MRSRLAHRPDLCYTIPGSGPPRLNSGGKDMTQAMTDKQFKTILEMVDMILDGCKDLNEAKQKV